MLQNGVGCRTSSSNGPGSSEADAMREAPGWTAPCRGEMSVRLSSAAVPKYPVGESVFECATTAVGKAAVPERATAATVGKAAVPEAATAAAVGKATVPETRRRRRHYCQNC